jgi:hypothetical protein
MHSREIFKTMYPWVIFLSFFTKSMNAKSQSSKVMPQRHCYEVICLYCDNEWLDSFTLVRVETSVESESARAHATDFAFVSAFCVSLGVLISSTKRRRGT